MPIYDSTNFDPPAPLALVTVRSPASRESVANVALLIDSGADVSLLPRAPIAHLIEPEMGGEQFELEGFDGSLSLVPAVRLELHFLGRVFRGQFLIIDQRTGILGRNILNAIPLLLDGPNLTWGVHP